MSNEFKAVPIEAFNRAIVMLSVAGNHCEDHAMSAISHYDDADCDGICINDDCKTVIEWLQQAHDGEVVYLIADNGDDRLRMVSESEFYKWPNERVQFYTAPPRVVDVEVTQSMVTVGINVGNASVAKYLANAEKDNLTDKYTTDRIYMYAALKAALEKT